MCPWVESHAPCSRRQPWGAARPCGVSLTTRGIAPASLRYSRLTPAARVVGPRAWQANPSRAVCRQACHQLLPWLQVTFAMVPDAARPGSDQWPWSTCFNSRTSCEFPKERCPWIIPGTLTSYMPSSFPCTLAQDKETNIR